MTKSQRRKIEISNWLVKSADHLASMMETQETMDAMEGKHVKFEVDIPNVGMTDLTETLNVLLALEVNRRDK